MPLPPPESKDDVLHQIAARLTVIEIAAAALIRASANEGCVEALLALQTMEQVSLEEDTGPPSPIGIAEYLRKAIDRLGFQAMGPDWRDYTLPSQLSD
jgi:hypothetical protein